MRIVGQYVRWPRPMKRIAATSIALSAATASLFGAPVAGENGTETAMKNWSESTANLTANDGARFQIMKVGEARCKMVYFHDGTNTDFVLTENVDGTSDLLWSVPDAWLMFEGKQQQSIASIQIGDDNSDNPHFATMDFTVASGTTDKRWLYASENLFTHEKIFRARLITAFPVDGSGLEPLKFELSVDHSAQAATLFADCMRWVKQGYADQEEAAPAGN